MTRILPALPWFLVVILFSTAPLLATQLELTQKGAHAYEVVRTASGFSDTAVGVAGSTPPVVFAFRDLLDEANADAIFKTLYLEGGTVAQLYALCGLWYTDPADFRVKVELLKKSEETVSMQTGCLMSKVKVADLVESHQPDVVRLKDNTQSIKQWLEASRAKNLSFDILGGGWPNKLRDEGGFREPQRAPKTR